MNGYERTVKFIAGEKTDHPPFMPLVVDWAAKQQNLDYLEFVHKPAARAQAYLKSAEEFNIDCVLPDADFYEQLADFGMRLNLLSGRYSGEPFINDLDEDHKNIKIPEIKSGGRMGNRLETLKLVADQVKGKKYIFGICVGPLTEFCNAREITKAFKDIRKNKEKVLPYLRIFHENNMRFIKAQMDSGADGIQIVEPNCSLVSPAQYEELIQPLHKEMVDYVQKNGGVTRLHVCGNTNMHISTFLATGTKVLDVDAAVLMGEAAAKLGEGQYLCGNIDPVGVVLQGTPQLITEQVNEIHKVTNNRTIISAGCDIPENTSAENMIAFYKACADLH